MKKQSKKKSIILLTILAVIAAVLMVLSFVPVQLGKYDYNSFFKSIPLSSDLDEGISIIYNYKTDHLEGSVAREKAVESTSKEIEKLLRENGYVGAKAAALGRNKIKIILSTPILAADLTKTMNLLGKGGIGCGMFELKAENKAEADALLNGQKHIKNVSVFSSSGSYFTVVEFTKAGKNILAEHEATAAATGQTVNYYLFFGGSSELTNGYAFTPSSNFVNGNLYVGTFDKKTYAEQYELFFRAGSFDVDLVSASTLDINFVKNEGSTALVILLVINLAVVLGFGVWFAVRYKLLAVVPVFTNLFVISISLLLFASMQWMEISIAGLALSALCLAYINHETHKIFEAMRNERQNGKTIEFSIDSGYRKCLPGMVVTSIFLVAAGITIATIFGSVFASIGTIVAMTGIFSLFFNLFFTKAMTNLLYGMVGENSKAFNFGGKHS